MKANNFKNAHTWKQWKKQYQKSMNSKAYQNKCLRIKKKIYYQLYHLVNPKIIEAHLPQIKATINHLKWYDTYSGIDTLLFMSYSLIYHNQPHQFDKLKKLYREYSYGMYNHNDDFEKMKQYQSQHGDLNGYNYQLIKTHKIIEMLWNYPKVRLILKTWLTGYIKIKRCYGAEVIQNAITDFKNQNRFIHLLTGFNQHNGIQLSRYKNHSKKWLTKSTWINQVQKQCIIINSCWD